MEPLFEAEYVMTEAVYIKFNRIHFRSHALFPLSISMGCVLSAFSLLGMVSGYYGGEGFTPADFLVYGVFFFLGVLLILLSFRLPDAMAKSVARTMRGRMGQPQTIRFFPGEYVEYTPRGEEHTSYTLLYRVVETDRMFLLYQSKVQANIVLKACLTRGTPEGLTAFLRGACRAPYKRIYM